MMKIKMTEEALLETVMSEFDLLADENKNLVSRLQDVAIMGLEKYGKIRLIKFIKNQLVEHGGFSYPFRAAIIIVNRAAAFNAGEVYPSIIRPL